MENHGVYVTRKESGVSTPSVAVSGVPFVIGAAPVQMASKKTKPSRPVLCTSWDEAVALLGYCEEQWGSFTLCEFMYSHFKLFGCQPVIFCNLLDIETMRESVPAQTHSLISHKLKLPLLAINDASLLVKAESGSSDPYVLDTDYSCYYSADSLIVEMLPGGACYDKETLFVSYSKVTPEAVTENMVAAGLESIELCMNGLGMVPDLICAPGFSQHSTVAAVMATKAAGINGMFAAKALVDIAADSGADAIAKKAADSLVDENEIVCWPRLNLGDKQFAMSTQLAGLMASVDSGNEGCPYESPSNKSLQCDGLVRKDGSEVDMTLAQANMLNANGIVTALNFIGGWVAWGNYTACYPASRDPKSYFIPVNRMFDWVGNTLIRTFWKKLDGPMNRRFIDSILDSCNIWLNGLCGSGYLLGARAVMLAEENPAVSLMAGKIKFHIFMTPPFPAQEIDFVTEYDAAYVAAALAI